MALTSAHLLKEKVPSLEKMATNAANRATADVGKALPADEKDKGLKLFEIVNQSLKRLRRDNAGRVTKTKTNQCFASLAKIAKLTPTTNRPFSEPPYILKREITYAVHCFVSIY